MSIRCMDFFVYIKQHLPKKNTTWTITIITKNEPNPDMCTILPTLLQSRVSEKNEKCPKMHTEIINLINKKPLSM